MSHTALGYAYSDVDPDRAREHLETAIASATRLDNMMAIGVPARALARLHVRQGDLKSAFELLAFCLDMARDHPAPMMAGLTCETVAAVLTAAGADEAAAKIAAAVHQASKADAANVFPRINDTITALRSAMGHDAYERAATQGRTMVLDDLTQFARSELNRVLAELHGR